VLYNRSMANGHTRTSVHYREQSATCGTRHSNGGFFSVASVAGGRKGGDKVQRREVGLRGWGSTSYLSIPGLRWSGAGPGGPGAATGRHRKSRYPLKGTGSGKGLTLIPRRGMSSTQSMAVGTLEQPLGAPPSPPGIPQYGFPGPPECKEQLSH
jgi:hypothetical protein